MKSKWHPTSLWQTPKSHNFFLMEITQLFICSHVPMTADCMYGTRRLLLRSSLTLWNAREDIKQQSLYKTEVALRTIQSWQQWNSVLKKKIFFSQCKFQKGKRFLKSHRDHHGHFEGQRNLSYGFYPKHKQFFRGSVALTWDYTVKFS